MEMLIVLELKIKSLHFLIDCVTVKLDMYIYLVPLIANHAKEIAQIVPLEILIHVLDVKLSQG